MVFASLRVRLGNSISFGYVIMKYSPGITGLHTYYSSRIVL
jgi:hypothetical protein